jgi:hypothetical protein
MVRSILASFAAMAGLIETMVVALPKRSQRPPMKSSKSNNKTPVTTKININSYYTFAHRYGSNYDIKKG